MIVRTPPPAGTLRQALIAALVNRDGKNAVPTGKHVAGYDGPDRESDVDADDTRRNAVKALAHTNDGKRQGGKRS